MFDIAKETVNLQPIAGSTIRELLLACTPPWWRRLSYRMLAARCVFCQAPGDLGDIDLCEPCLQSLPWSHNNGPIKALFDYRPPISSALIALKFQADFRYAAVFGTLLGLAWQRAFVSMPHDRPTGIVPIPLHPLRLRERGFNQVSLIARSASHIVGWPVLPHTLRRERDTSPQTRLDAAARRQNLQHAFRLGVAAQPPSSSLMVLDDVVTTGATLAAASAAWPAAQEIHLWAVARAMPTNMTNPIV